MSESLENTNPSAHIKAMVHRAATIITPVWPMSTFIACNPLQGFESMPFEEALQEGARLYGTHHAHPNLDRVNREMIKWCSAFLDMGQGTIEMPYRAEGFYAGFRTLSQYDTSLHQGSDKHKVWLSQLPEEPEHAIHVCFAQLGVSPENQETFMKESLSHLPGWAGYVKWRHDWRNSSVSEIDKTPITLLDFLAVRFVITTLLWPDAFYEKKIVSMASTSQDHVMRSMVALEEKYRDHLVTQICAHTTRQQPKVPTRADAQFVFCIDVRSEPFRRCLESTGAYETFGFAGFFGLPVRIHDYNTGESSDSCPVLLKPRYDIHDIPTIQSLHCATHRARGKERIHRFKQAYQNLKYNFSTSFSLVETLGAWCGAMMLVRTLMPVRFTQLSRWLIEKIMPTVHTQPIVTMNKGDSLSGIAPGEQVLYAETVLKMMGLTKHFSPLVVFCGHGSTTENNPYASALDCGACGGNHGGANAKILAAILNRESVRAALYERGIIIPEDTRFKAAEHNTTTDAVVIYPEDNEHNIDSDLMKKVRIDLDAAQAMNSKKRCMMFDGSPPKNPIHATQQRSHDWSEVRPEWGLARNAAFIIGPRQVTKSIDLEGRCFLHSYAWDEDENSSCLETIMTAPMVVAEWINTQYLFSTLDNVAYGSGSKITHNVTSKIGVMQGNGSDLMHGLPLQSVMVSDEQPYHQAQRLLVVICAPKSKIDPIIARQDILKTLFFNGWVTLIAIEPDDNLAYQLDRQGHWHCITPVLGMKNKIPQKNRVDVCV